MRRLSALLVWSLLSCRTPEPLPVTPSPTVAVAPPIKLTLVGTNDVHGWVMEQVEHFPQGDIRYGGVANFAGYLKVLREDNPGGVVLVDAGDLFQGTLMSNLTEGSVVIDAFNQLGYDAASIGNHEFDYGPVGPVSVATQAGMDPFGALKARIAQARFPLLSTNIYERDTGLRPAWLKGDGSVIIERKGLKVGIFGLTTPQTPTTTVPVNVASLRFGALAPEALTASRRLRDRGADVVVAVVHAGGKCADAHDPHQLSSCDADSGEVFEMMRGLPPGTLDAVVAGHTHAQMGHFIAGTPVIESWALGRFFGLIELSIDPATRKVLPEQTHLASAIPICGTVDAESKSCELKELRARADAVKPVPPTFRMQALVPDPAVLRVIAPAEQEVSALQNRDVGVLVPQTLGRNYETESPLGDLLADSLRELCHADVALLNPGGLRADLKAGALRYGAVYEVLPFDNAVATLELTGEQLTRLLNAAYGSRKGVFQLSGLHVELSRCPGPQRLHAVRLADGRNVEPQARYRVVMPDFLARGGDGLGPVLATVDPSQVDLGENRGQNLRDELVAYWAAHPHPLTAPRAGRVSFIADEDGCSPGARIDAQTSVP
jgi:5'-nucleotidase